MRSIKQVAFAIVQLLQNLIKWPETEFENRRIAAAFSRRSKPHKMPNVCGAIDGSLINIIAPKKSGGAFINRYGSTALNVLGLKFH